MTGGETLTVQLRRHQYGPASGQGRAAGLSDRGGGQERPAADRLRPGVDLKHLARPGASP
ncbi:hypothetical protein ACRAWD_29840 [Caulobacter segnis]